MPLREFSLKFSTSWHLDYMYISIRAGRLRSQQPFICLILTSVTASHLGTTTARDIWLHSPCSRMSPAVGQRRTWSSSCNHRYLWSSHGRAQKMPAGLLQSQNRWTSWPLPWNGTSRDNVVVCVKVWKVSQWFEWKLLFTYLFTDWFYDRLWSSTVNVNETSSMCLNSMCPLTPAV